MDGFEGAAVFEAREGAFVPTQSAVGPWSPDALQGSATAALMVRALEAHASFDGMQAARLSFDLWRAASRAPLTAAVDVPRDGRKARTVEVRLMQDGQAVARLTAILLRAGTTPALRGVEPEAPPAGPETGTPIDERTRSMSPYFQGVEVRTVKGEILRPGPAAAWMRLRRPLVDAETASALAQAVCAADLVAGVSQLAHPRELGFVNADLTLNLKRPPAGEWMLLDARTEPGPFGAGVAMARLADLQGTFGWCAASLLFEAR